MAKYTVELRRVCDTFTRNEVEKWFKDWELSDYLTPEEIAVVETKGTFSKDSLAQQIVDAYYLREIGFESVGMFKHYAKTTMRQIMGTYAQLIYSASIQFDPLVNEDFTETFRANRENTANSSSSSNGSGFGIQSDTPQGQMNKSNLLSGKYASNAQASEDETSGQTEANGKEEENYIRTTKGNRGISSNIPYLLTQYRKYIMNIYGDIIKECNVLFMGIW